MKLEDLVLIEVMTPEIMEQIIVADTFEELNDLGLVGLIHTTLATETMPRVFYSLKGEEPVIYALRSDINSFIYKSVGGSSDFAAMSSIADATEETVVDTLNLLLQGLRNAGIMAE